MKFSITIYEGEIIPKWYRIAYVNFASFSSTCYPVGLHLFVRWPRRLWELSFRYNQSKYEKAIQRAFMEGRREGTNLAYKRLKQIYTLQND